ncbi:MAG: hypothetical protein JW802_06840 [Campylobacterales bacterium]|nr:hypothetical protein [Campylobacterales bacterium]
MVGFLIVVVLVASVFVGRYFVKRFFTKGKGKFYTYFMSTCIAVGFCFFGIMTVAIYDTSKNPRVTDPVVKDQYFKEDQKMVLDYLNTINSTMLFVDEILEEHKQALLRNDMLQALSSARDCIDTYKDVSEDFLMRKFRAPMLYNKDMKEIINKSAFEYSTLYRLKTRYCENSIKYINTKNNSALESAKFDTNEILNQSVVATASTFSIGEKYNLKYQNKKWVVSQ